MIGTPSVEPLVFSKSSPLLIYQIDKIIEHAIAALQGSIIESRRDTDQAYVIAAGAHSVVTITTTYRDSPALPLLRIEEAQGCTLEMTVSTRILRNVSGRPITTTLIGQLSYILAFVRAAKPRTSLQIEYFFSPSNDQAIAMVQAAANTAGLAGDGTRIEVTLGPLPELTQVRVSQSDKLEWEPNASFRQKLWPLLRGKAFLSINDEFMSFDKDAVSSGKLVMAQIGMPPTASTACPVDAVATLRLMPELGNGPWFEQVQEA